MKCTGTDSSIGANQYLWNRMYVTGTDYQALHGQTVTLSFWAKTAGANSGDTYYISLANGAQNRVYVQNFTATNAWTRFTYTIDLDTSGTWYFTEADIGLRVHFVLARGTDGNGGTIGSWVDPVPANTGEQWDTSIPISNFLDSTSNEFYLSQVSLTLGSTAPTFSSPPIATVQSQVDYYVESISGYIGSGWANTSNAGMGVCHWATKRRAPTVTYIDQTLFYIETSTSGGNATTMGMYLAKERSGRWSWARSGASHTVGSGAVARADGTGRLLVDARH
jgi:hypothetical protein